MKPSGIAVTRNGKDFTRSQLPIVDPTGLPAALRADLELWATFPLQASSGQERILWG